MTIYWPDPPLAASTEPGNTGLAFQVPDEVLQRHNARVLQPATAAEGAAGPALQPTAYVANVLLIPFELRGAEQALNSLLQPVNMTIEPMVGDPDLPQLAVPVVLRPVPGPVPVQVDAWTALQAIRANSTLGPRIGLDHLMFASPLTWDLGGAPGAIQGFAPPFGAASPVTDGYLDGPVVLEMPPLAPKPVTELKLGRRPVVAVLDTGIGHNSWLKIDPLDALQPMSSWQTGHVVVDDSVQAAVENASLSQKGFSGEVIRHAKDQPLTRNPFIGTQDWCFGHGLFCAGVIKQIAPDSTVLAIRVMGSDGVARESAVLAALQGLVTRVNGAFRSGDMTEMVDVVSLSMGFLFERSEAEERTSPLAVQIGLLRERGVLVTAAIGNSASNRRFFPACLSTLADTLTTPPVVSVGALNPNGSIALFTNETPTCYASGVNVISTFPQDANASRQPLVQVPAANRPGLPPFRQTPDVDDHTHSPFAVWTGTSFATPHIAAHLAKALQDMQSVGTTADEKQEQATIRAARAVDVVRKAAQLSP
ncbi:S8 family serine peptidase [Lentzea sp. NPDC092896]|uniref:S8 family serine peptidase n=1 Tax=Lentzea sp. NPDC092896 TaxID=3364127 RepID=UPI0037FBF0D9